MVSIPIAFILALVAALVLTPLARAGARRLGAIDEAGASFRKIHAQSIPRLGGIAIVLAFYAPLLGLLVVDAGMTKLFTQDMAKTLGLLIGGVPIVLLGLYDDTVGASASQKVLVQLGVAASLYVLGFQIHAVSTPFGTLHLGLFAMPVTVMWIVGVINALNLIDGLDGLASGIAFFGAVTTLAVAYANDNALMMLFMATLTGAILGFLVYNFNPATIFMGDTGSMFLGYVVAVTAVQTNTKGAATVAMLTPVLALGVPIMDTFLAMARRALRGQSMFQADKEHIHHRLMALGLSHRRTVLVLYGVTILFGATGILLAVLKGPQTALVLVTMAVIAVIGMRQLGYLQLRRVGELTALRRRNLDLRRACREARVRLRAAADLDGVWAVLVTLVDPLGIDELHLALVGRPALTWSEDVAMGPPLSLTVDLAVGGQLTFTWRDGREAYAPGDEIAAETVADDVADALVRLGFSTGAEVIPLTPLDPQETKNRT